MLIIHIRCYYKLYIDSVFLNTFFETTSNTFPFSSVLQLSDEELEKRVLMLQKDLRAVYNGKLHSQRHVQYMEGGNRRRKSINNFRLVFCL